MMQWLLRARCQHVRMDFNRTGCEQTFTSHAGNLRPS